MIDSLKKKLIHLYTLLTSCILILAVILVSFLGYKTSCQKNHELLNGYLTMIYQKMTSEISISHNWLSSMEHNNQLIISIEENQKPLLYESYQENNPVRATLVKKVRDLALEDQVDYRNSAITSSYIQSPILSLHYNTSSYLGTVLIFSKDNNFYSVTLVLDISKSQHILYIELLLTFLVICISIFALYLANKKLISRCIHPVLENEKKQQAFIAAASHELRSPLSVILASADTAIKAPTHSEQMLSTIIRESKRMSHLIEEMLLLSTSKSEQFTMPKKNIDMDTLLLNIYESYAPLCQNSGCKLQLEFPDNSLPEFYGNETYITQILTILIDNALAHAKGTKTIEMTATVLPKQLHIRIIDHGPGIPLELQSHIFENFFRMERSRENKQHFGLGLSVAAELARRNDGVLLFEETPSGGCTFCLKLPLSVK